MYLLLNETSSVQDAVERHPVHPSGPKHSYPQWGVKDVTVGDSADLPSSLSLARRELPSPKLHAPPTPGWWEVLKAGCFAWVWCSSERPYQSRGSLENGLRALVDNESQYKFSLCPTLFPSLPQSYALNHSPSDLDTNVHIKI